MVSATGLVSTQSNEKELEESMALYFKNKNKKTKFQDTIIENTSNSNK